MHLHPELRALRGNDTPQREAQALLIDRIAGWKRRPDAAAPLAEMADFADFRPLADCPALSALFVDGVAGSRFVGGFIDVACAGLNARSLGQVPMRHFTDGTVSTLLLARTGDATLSLVAIDGPGLAARPDPRTVDFGPTETWERVLAGSADASLVACHPQDARSARLTCRPARLAPGDVLHRDGSREALLLRRVRGCLVSLRLQRRRRSAGPTREYALADGALVHQAAGDPRDSRTELMIALLGRMGRADAAPLIAQIAQGQDSPALRWQALRECLALDTLAGFQALTEVARSAGDPLSPQAGALRAQLIEAYPQLSGVETCPA